MNVRIIETGEIKNLTMKGRNGIEWTRDLFGDYEDSVKYNKELETYEMSEDNFEWWEEYINDYNNDEEELTELAQNLLIDESEIRDKIINKLNCSYDLSDEHSFKQEVFKKIKEEKTKFVGKLWGEITRIEKEGLLEVANTVHCDGNDMDKREGGCIVDFEGFPFSIGGNLTLIEWEDSIERKIEIGDEEVFYLPHSID